MNTRFVTSYFQFSCVSVYVCFRALVINLRVNTKDEEESGLQGVKTRHHRQFCGRKLVVIQSTQYKRLQVAPEKRCLCGEILDKRAGFKYTLIKKDSNLGQRKNTLRSLS